MCSHVVSTFTLQTRYKNNSGTSTGLKTGHCRSARARDRVKGCLWRIGRSNYQPSKGCWHALSKPCRRIWKPPSTNKKDVWYFRDNRNYKTLWSVYVDGEMLKDSRNPVKGALLTDATLHIPAQPILCWYAQRCCCQPVNSTDLWPYASLLMLHFHPWIKSDFSFPSV